MIARFCFSVSLLLLLNAALFPGKASASSCTAPVQAGLSTELQALGQTRLRVMLFRVYDAELATDSGRYPEYDHLTLHINYLRSIRAEALVDTTADEWTKLGIEKQDSHQQWLQQLREMWPDVRDGDCLVAHHAKGEGITFYNAEGRLGAIESETFANDFLAIWLDEQSSFRRNRDQLLGVQP